MRATEAISFVFSYAATNLSRESSLKIFLLIFFHPFFIVTVFIIFVIIDISWNCYRSKSSFKQVINLAPFNASPVTIFACRYGINRRWWQITCATLADDAEVPLKIKQDFGATDWGDKMHLICRLRENFSEINSAWLYAVWRYNHVYFFGIFNSSLMTKPKKLCRIIATKVFEGGIDNAAYLSAACW